MDPNVRVRPIADDDWDGVVALEAGAYTALGLSEERAALESKVRASPATCFALDVERRLVGYLLALPYPESAYPDLSRPEEAVFHSRNLHLHDLVIAEDLRGRGLGKRLLRRLATGARQQGYERISLVAVGGSHTFWSANGFTADDGVDSGGYGVGSVYMSMAVSPEQVAGATPVGGPLSGTPSRDEVGQA
jgi:GNAT superfamily N-acetyltransferase